jgi:2-dehydro-3-deoxygluconokinase
LDIAPSDIADPGVDRTTRRERPSGPEVVALGEVMLRLSVAGSVTLEDAAAFEVFVGGAEANVSVALARLGRRVELVTRVGGGPHGRRVVAHLRRHGVGTDRVVVDEDRRTGLYFTESGEAPRGVSVVYDRADSAATRLSPDDIVAGSLDGVAVALVSGITAALGGSCRATVDRFVAEAAAAGAAVVFDVNHRERLWDAATAREVVTPLCRAAHVVVCTAEDAGHVLGVGGSATERASALAERFGGAVVVTDGASGVAWSGVTDGGTTTGWSPSVPTGTVDRIGAGDAFCAGVVDGVLDGDVVAGVRRGQVMASLKRTVGGDCFLGGRSDVDRVLAEIDGASVDGAGGRSVRR